MTYSWKLILCLSQNCYEVNNSLDETDTTSFIVLIVQEYECWTKLFQIISYGTFNFMLHLKCTLMPVISPHNFFISNKNELRQKQSTFLVDELKKPNRPSFGCSSQVLTVLQKIRVFGLRQTEIKVKVTVFELSFFSFAEYVTIILENFRNNKGKGKSKKGKVRETLSFYLFTSHLQLIIQIRQEELVKFPLQRNTAESQDFNQVRSPPLNNQERHPRNFAASLVHIITYLLLLLPFYVDQ